MSFEDLAQRHDIPNEVVLIREPLSSQLFAARSTSSLLPNAFAVANGGMRPFWFGSENERDLRDRADHKAWDRFWMSLTGAVIEAIALSWGEPLQSVLEASDFSTSENVLEAPVATADGHTVIAKEVDIIRRASQFARNRDGA